MAVTKTDILKSFCCKYAAFNIFFLNNSLVRFLWANTIILLFIIFIWLSINFWTLKALRMKILHTIKTPNTVFIGPIQNISTIYLTTYLIFFWIRHPKAASHCDHPHIAFTHSTLYGWSQWTRTLYCEWECALALPFPRHWNVQPNASLLKYFWQNWGKKPKVIFNNRVTNIG